MCSGAKGCSQYSSVIPKRSHAFFRTSINLHRVSLEYDMCNVGELHTHAFHIGDLLFILIRLLWTSYTPIPFKEAMDEIHTHTFQRGNG